MRKNADIRVALTKNNVFCTEVARKWNMDKCFLSNVLNKFELAKCEKTKFLDAINEIAKEKEVEV